MCNTIAIAFRDGPQDLVATLDRKRFADAAGHDPSGMHPLAAEPLDDLLPELAHADAVAGNLGIAPQQAKDVASSRVGVEAQ